ncbi:MAG: hypothetical protein R3Y26_03860 [Rikenellaceae bacterium]
MNSQEIIALIVYIAVMSCGIWLMRKSTAAKKHKCSNKCKNL